MCVEVNIRLEKFKSLTMQIMGYNRFTGEDKDKTIMYLSTKDFEETMEGIYRLRDNARGYRVHICLIPENLKYSFRETDLFQILEGYFRIGSVLITQFVFYDEEYQKKLLQSLK